MKKHALAASMLALALLASGCSATSGSSGSSGSDGVIRYLHRLPDGEGMTKVNDIVARWNAEHPDMKVEATKFDGKAPDMTSSGERRQGRNRPVPGAGRYAEIPKLYSSGLLADVSSEAEKYKSHFSEGSMSLMTVGKTTVGLPQDSGPLVYFYNKAAFDQLGLSVPTTSAELADVAQKAAAQGKYALAFEPDEAPNTLAGQSAAAGAQWFTADNDKWKVNVTSPETAKVSTFWQGVLDSKTPSWPTAGTTPSARRWSTSSSSAPSAPPGRARSWPTR